MATEAIKQDELNEAVSLNLLSPDDAREFMQHKRREEIQSIRDGQPFLDSSKHKHKQ